MSKVASFWQNAALTPLQIVESQFLTDKNLRLYIKREDLIHPYISGNKWRKLKYNLIEAENLGYTKLLTFGGAYSNHIVAVAAAGKAIGFDTVGIIRGHELLPTSNWTLKFAHDCGMKLIFVSRDAYRQKDQLITQYANDAYILPEGGTNHLAIKGVGELAVEIDQQLNYVPNYIGTAVGTGGTFAGICSQAKKQTKVLGFSSLKNASLLLQDINNWIDLNKSNFEFFENDIHGGYGKITPQLIDFIKRFEKDTQIPLEQVYTGKMMYRIWQLIDNDYFEKGATIVAIHTGGLQGRHKLLDE